jgi:hypothetical protein
MYLTKDSIKGWSPGYRTTSRLGTRGYEAAWNMRTTLRSVAFDAGCLLKPHAEDNSRREGMVPDTWKSIEIARNLLYKALEEVILVLNRDRRVSSDRKLSAIRFQQPKSDENVTFLLSDTADILSTSIVKENERSSTVLGGPSKPRQAPMIKVMVSNLECHP